MFCSTGGKSGKRVSSGLVWGFLRREGQKMAPYPTNPKRESYRGARVTMSWDSQKTCIKWITSTQVLSWTVPLIPLVDSRDDRRGKRAFRKYLTLGETTCSNLTRSGFLAEKHRGGKVKCPFRREGNNYSSKCHFSQRWGGGGGGGGEGWADGRRETPKGTRSNLVEG